MESMKYDWTIARGQTCKDKDALPRLQQHSSPPPVMTWDTSYICDAEDLELARKRRELHLIEEQIARKKASIALKKNELQRTTLQRENDNQVDKEEWNRQMETDTQHEKPSLLTSNNCPQRPPHLTERQISILNELTQPHVSAFEPSDPAPFMKSFVEKRNAEILQRDSKEKRTSQSDFNATLTPEHKVEALRPHHHSEHALPSPGYKPSDPAPFMTSFVEKRNAEILQRDLKEKRTSQLHFNATLTPEHKVEALRPHHHSEHALPSPGYKMNPPLQKSRRNTPSSR
ncbi:uncharacterized protein LOC121718004 isoform X4 [Alosa sapidissima]|uniref:uncharacterized protein LOC121718004 isoform X4 n=1 Tax=Alosa sapidissima TaxID=34773 RepID=UPI001C0951C6|nr:uncharacterized protein LOC121718004 isoform X4 [Alosa sapidissima]